MTFNGLSDFKRSQFLDKTNFENVSFKNYIIFYNSKFDTVSFKKAVFSHGADFDNCTFANNVSFSLVKFENKVGFNYSTFKGEANYQGVKFYADVWFDDVEFYEAVDFLYTSFEDNAWFARAKFSKEAEFDSCHFHQVSEFECSVFDNVGHFEKVFFHTSIPNFRGCKIDGTCLEFTSETQFSKDDCDIYALRKISFLKRLADHHGQNDQALEFNAIELRAKRRYFLNRLDRIPRIKHLTSSEWWSSHATLIYEQISDFGRSFERPFFLYILLMVVTAILILIASGLMYSPKLCDGDVALKWGSDLARTNQCANEVNMPMNAYRAAFEYSLYRTSGLIHFADQGKAFTEVNQRLFGQPIEPICVRIVGLLISVSSMVLIFFIALGLRNRYRIK